ncbi:hypothetical protein GGR50DRAFT_558189 [Xylaria sp. CBS 124048]|nr:hypothetical protein GGR50DRAFT_558189 [Xylaria sp. CBS 124048]
MGLLSLAMAMAMAMAIAMAHRLLYRQSVAGKGLCSVVKMIMPPDHGSTAVCSPPGSTLTSAMIPSHDTSQLSRRGNEDRDNPITTGVPTTHNRRRSRYRQLGITNTNTLTVDTPRGRRTHVKPLRVMSCFEGLIP